MIKNISAIIFSTFLFSAISQESLDSIFNDKKRNTHLILYSDPIRIVSGIPNIGGQANLFNDKIIVNSELGLPFFGYRIGRNFPYGVFENKVKGGVVFGFSALYNLRESNKVKRVRFTIGCEYEYWNYSSENLNVAAINSFELSNSYVLYGYNYTLETNNKFRFNRVFNRIGFVTGWIVEGNRKNDVSVFFHFGYLNQGVVFNSKKSFGVNWGTTPPEGVVKDIINKSLFYTRLSFYYPLSNLSKK